jgi:hypothetical protein
MPLLDGKSDEATTPTTGVAAATRTRTNCVESSERGPDARKWSRLAVFAIAKMSISSTKRKRTIGCLWK